MTTAARRFLFLQGPPGPFFRLLGQELAARGASVRRINLSGGDRYDWQGPETLDYRGTMRRWPAFFDAAIRRDAITDLVLFGDCRPVHQTALRLAQLRGVHVHVFEEGYIRPDWMTLERDGVNGHSRFDRDPAIIMAGARWLPDIPALPPITATFGRRARQAAQTLRRVAQESYFLFPLQLSGDYQIRAHSPFPDMASAARYVLRSFAAHAPAGSVLLVKEHPLDSGYRNWRRFLRRHAARLGVAGRVRHIDGGDLQALAQGARGVVCVNSTSGTLALEVGTPVIVLGDAVYDVPGVTHPGSLDGFWAAPQPPDRALYDAFKKTLHAKCLVRGGLASESALRILIRNSVERLLADAAAAPALSGQTSLAPPVPLAPDG